MFWRSMSPPEAEHIVEAFGFELGKVRRVEIRSRVLDHLVRIDTGLASRVAVELGLPVPESERVDDVPVSPALSQLNLAPDSIATRKIAILAADGADSTGIDTLRAALADRGATAEVLAPHGGRLRSDGSGELVGCERELQAKAPVFYDRGSVASGGDEVASLVECGPAVHDVLDAFKDAKPVGAVGGGARV